MKVRVYLSVGALLLFLAPLGCSDKAESPAPETPPEEQPTPEPTPAPETTPEETATPTPTETPTPEPTKEAGEMKVHFLDVGQGDGIVVEIENRWNILIDGGSTNKNELGKYQLLPYLKSRGISRLDGIYVSHTDEDHISGVRELLEFVEKDLTSLRIENLILPKWSDIQENKNYRELTELAESAGVRVLTVKAGDEIRYGTVRLKVLWPESTASGKEVNEDAMVLEMISKDFKGLFTGDIGADTEKKLLAAGGLEDVDCLKVGHHGSRYSTTEAFLEKIKPEVAIISCSLTNTYGHPSPETVERLKAAGSQVEYTMKNGAITVETDGKKLKIGRFRKNR